MNNTTLVSFGLGVIAGICLGSAGAIAGVMAHDALRAKWLRYQYRRAYRRFLARIPTNVRAELSPGALDAILREELWDDPPPANDVVMRFSPANKPRRA